MDKLESIVIDLCKQSFDLNAQRMCKIGYTGVWVGDKKVAAIGVHCKRYVTYHGLALNCNIDLDWFRHIVPCGIKDKEVGSLSEICKRVVTVEQVSPLLIESFSRNFDVELNLKKFDASLLSEIE